MKKIILFLTCILFVVGCSCSNDKATDAVEKYLNEYKGLSDNVLKDVDKLIEKEEIEDKHRDTYKEIMKKQYRDLNYTIENETYDGDEAKVTVKITVYDLYKVEKDAREHLNKNQEDFLTDGVYDAKKYLEYKLDKMKDVNETISYNIVFKVIKSDGKWQVEQPNEETLEKIHGIYNYEQD